MWPKLEVRLSNILDLIPTLGEELGKSLTDSTKEDVRFSSLLSG